MITKSHFGIGFRLNHTPYNSYDSFPLTPALSPVERESRTRCCEKGERFSWVEEPAIVLPLHKGEGRVEGEAVSRKPKRSEFCKQFSTSSLFLLAALLYVTPGFAAEPSEKQFRLLDLFD